METNCCKNTEENANGPPTFQEAAFVSRKNSNLILIKMPKIILVFPGYTYCLVDILFVPVYGLTHY